MAPIKHMSIPELQLKTATLGAELVGFCETEMIIVVRSNHFFGLTAQQYLAGSNQKTDKRCKQAQQNS